MTETRPILCLCVRRPEQDGNHNLLEFAGKGQSRIDTLYLDFPISPMKQR